MRSRHIPLGHVSDEKLGFVIGSMYKTLTAFGELRHQ